MGALGLYSKRIGIYRASEVSDLQGGFVSGGELVYTRWATIREQNQAQRQQAGQVGNDKTYNISMDAKGVTLFLTDVIIYQNNRLDILTLGTKEEKGLQYLITAVERKKV